MMMVMDTLLFIMVMVEIFSIFNVVIALFFIMVTLVRIVVFGDYVDFIVS